MSAATARNRVNESLSSTTKSIYFRRRTALRSDSPPCGDAAGDVLGFSDIGYGRPREVKADDFTSRAALLRHHPSAPLTQTDAVAESAPFYLEQGSGLRRVSVDHERVPHAASHHAGPERGADL